MKNFRTFDLAVEFYRLCRGLKLHTGLRDQLARASQSIALNLAEGRARPTVADQKKFFYISLGSARECRAILILAGLEESAHFERLDKLSAHLYRLIMNAG
jgi:four helix bundle protein